MTVSEPLVMLGGMAPQARFLHQAVTHSLSHSLTHSFTCSLTRSNTHSLTHSLFHSLVTLVIVFIVVVVFLVVIVLLLVVVGVVVAVVSLSSDSWSHIPDGAIASFAPNVPQHEIGCYFGLFGRCF